MSEQQADLDAAFLLALRILSPGDDDDVTLGQLRSEYGITPGESVFQRFPDAFDDRQRPVSERLVAHARSLRLRQS